MTEPKLSPLTKRAYEFCDKYGVPSDVLLAAYWDTLAGMQDLIDALELGEQVKGITDNERCLKSLEWQSAELWIIIQEMAAHSPINQQLL